MEQLRVRVPGGTMRKEIGDHVTALCGVLRKTDMPRKTRFLGKFAALNRGIADRRTLNWLRRSDEEFTGIVERSSAGPISTAAKRELVALKNRSGAAIARLLTEQFRLEEELAVLVEDVYELDAEERELLRATRPVRDPLDVLKGSLGAGGLPYSDAEHETSGK